MNQLDNTLFALSNQTRRSMISQLAEHGPARVTEIAQTFDISLNAVSKHLKVLESANLIRRTKQGRNHILSLNPSPLKIIADWLHPYEKFWLQKLDQIELYFKNQQKGNVK